MLISKNVVRALSARGLSWLSLGDLRSLGIHRLVKLAYCRGGVS